MIDMTLVFEASTISKTTKSKVFSAHVVHGVSFAQLFGSLGSRRPRKQISMGSAYAFFMSVGY